MDGPHDGDTEGNPPYEQGAYRGRGRAPNGAPFGRPPIHSGRPPRNADSSTIDGGTQGSESL